MGQMLVGAGIAVFCILIGVSIGKNQKTDEKKAGE